MHVYAIGDIHGHLDLLKGVHDLIAADMALHGPGQVVHVGDLVDRGPDSRGVIAHLRQGIEAGQDWVVLKGNHDRMVARFMADPAEPEEGLRPDLSWLHPRLGGVQTLESYGVRSPGDRPIAAVHGDALLAVPPSDLEFLRSRPGWHRAGGVIFVHAGIRPGVPMPRQRETDLVWIRAPFLEYTEPHEALVVHGHTAIDMPTHYGNRVNIDSSAAYGGPLSAIVTEEDGGAVFRLTFRGRVPVLP